MQIPGTLLGPGAEFQADIGGPRRLEDVEIYRGEAPVDGPTLRGGAYVSDGPEYRMRATVRGTGVLPHLTGMMLGPSAESARLEVSARAPGGRYVVSGSLAGSVQRPDSVELRIIITGIGRA